MGTTLIGQPGDTPRRAGTTLAEPLHGTGTRLAAPPTGGNATPTQEARGPVTGWLVVTAGPGRGRSLELGYGMNIVGRGPSNRVILDFGDDQISQDDHFRIAYDGANKRFHLMPGRGTNLVYIGTEPLLAPVDLDGASNLAVGATSLRFVPLCSTAWDWPTDSAAG